GSKGIGRVYTTIKGTDAVARNSLACQEFCSANFLRVSYHSLIAISVSSKYYIKLSLYMWNGERIRYSEEQPQNKQGKISNRDARQTHREKPSSAKE
ncbi:MAG: hypothetical protein UU06_C0044G0008, partial [Parcubacteria group bacterium GW2011_GWB1_40_5]